MFEKNPPVDPSAHPLAGSLRFGGESAARDANDEAQLRAIEWNELTARLEAARDLRRVLQGNGSGHGSEFADAAARYLSGRDELVEDVNLVALEHSKGSPGMITGPKEKTDPTARSQTFGEWGHAATAGDARQD